VLFLVWEWIIESKHYVLYYIVIITHCCRCSDVFEWGHTTQQRSFTIHEECNICKLSCTTLRLQHNSTLCRGLRLSWICGPHWKNVPVGGL